MQAYLDNAATTAVLPQAAQAAQRAMTECYGNPSSLHPLGRQARELLQTARGQVARAVGCGAPCRSAQKPAPGPAYCVNRC